MKLETAAKNPSSTGDAGGEADEASGASWYRPVIVVLLLAALVVTVVFRDTVLGALLDFVSWAEGLGTVGTVALVGFYIVACLLFLPGSIITLGAGFAFGLVKGTIAVIIGATLGAAAAFLLARLVFRSSVERMLENRPRFHAIDRAVGREGFKIVLLTRLSPVFPFNMLNFGFGVTNVAFKHYFLASFIGMLPGTVMYVYFGTLAQNLTELAAGRSEGGAAQTAILVVGLIATVAVTVLITRIARRALNEAIGEDDGEPAAAAGDQGGE